MKNIKNNLKNFSGQQNRWILVRLGVIETGNPFSSLFLKKCKQTTIKSICQVNSRKRLDVGLYNF